ncbi:prepilin peptidase [Candidatus Peregrinibacteria bacterium]|nr:prepilin peptidase [Candidatus Peregrinibacteria bacterium]
MMLTIVFTAILFILGAAVGSFTSVVIYRLHTKEKGIFGGKSSCTECKTVLKPLDLVPILSYLVLRGKCRYCSKEISYMYPLLELITGALFALLFLKFQFIDANFVFSEKMLAMYILFAFYTFVLVFTFFYDLHYLKVSDEILLPAILIGLIATLATPETPHFIDALIGAGIGIAFFGLQILASRGKWVGLGDLRVGAFMGVILGWKFMIIALFLSYFIGSAVSIFIAIKQKKFYGVKVPFAPFLVTGTFLTIFFGDKILSWYLGGMGF